MNDVRNIDGTSFFSCKAAAERLGKTPTYVAKLCRDGKIKATKIEGAWFVALPDAPPAPPAPAAIPRPPRIASIKQSVRDVANKPAGATRKTASTAAATSTQSPVTTLVRRVVSNLPTQPNAALPVAYVRALPMVVGVVMTLALFFVGTLPFMSQSLASLSQIEEPFAALLGNAASFESHFVRKTDELMEYSALSANVGVTALGKQLAAHAHEVQTHDRPRGVHARPSALARTLDQTPRIPVGLLINQNLQLAATAALSLYQFETKDAQYSFTSAQDVSWGCIFGFDSCKEKIMPVPLRGITVYDIKTKQVHCLQVVSGAATSTPGYCDIEDR